MSVIFVDVREESESEGITDAQGFSFHSEDALPFYPLDRIEITVRSRMPL